jgi:hypothetical protein
MQNKPSIHSDGVPNPFIQKHQADVIGVLRGFDRLRLAGTFRALYHPPVMEKYIQKTGFLLKDFKQLMLQITGQIKTATQQIAERTGRPLTYLSSSQVRKEQVARQIAQKDGVSSGLIAILSCVEPCRTYTVGGNPQTKMLEAQLGFGKCLHYYFYHFHPVFGFMHGTPALLHFLAACEDFPERGCVWKTSRSAAPLCGHFNRGIKYQPNLRCTSARKWLEPQSNPKREWSGTVAKSLVAADVRRL